MIVQVRIEVKGELQLQRIIVQAVSRGFMRVDPRKVWSQLEYKEAAKYCFEHICNEALI